MYNFYFVILGLFVVKCSNLIFNGYFHDFKTKQQPILSISCNVEFWQANVLKNRTLFTENWLVTWQQLILLDLMDIE